MSADSSGGSGLPAATARVLSAPDFQQPPPPASVESANQQRSRAASMPTAAGVRAPGRIAMATSVPATLRASAPRPLGAQGRAGPTGSGPLTGLGGPVPACAAGGRRQHCAPCGRPSRPGREQGGSPRCGCALEGTVSVGPFSQQPLTPPLTSVPPPAPENLGSGEQRGALGAAQAAATRPPPPEGARARSRPTSPRTCASS